MEDLLAFMPSKWTKKFAHNRFPEETEWFLRKHDLFHEKIVGKTLLRSKSHHQIIRGLLNSQKASSSYRTYEALIKDWSENPRLIDYSLIGGIDYFLIGGLRDRYL